VVVNVSDDGPGIPPELRERIFDRFFRADESRRRGGAGLGLSIARWIVHEHGGRISATGNDRGGASFVAELPSSNA
jgi:signal transduction histidine kinase